jgi:hypothetical protein
MQGPPFKKRGYQMRLPTSKSTRTIKKNLRELRKLIDETFVSDPLTSRIAYAMECAVRWVLEDTKDWPSLAQEAREQAEIARTESQD